VEQASASAMSFEDEARRLADLVSRFRTAAEAQREAQGEAREKAAPSQAPVARPRSRAVLVPALRRMR